MRSIDHRAALALLLLASTLGVMAGATIMPVLEVIRTDLGVSGTAAGLIITTHGLAIAISSPLAGWMIDRWGVRLPLAGGLILYGLAGGAGLVIGSYPALIASRFLFGIGAALVFAGTTVAMLGLYQGVVRNMVMGWRTTATSLGGVVFPILAGAVGTLLSWHAAFGVYLIGVPLGLAALMVIPDARNAPGATPAQAASSLELLRRPALLGVYAFTLALSVMMRIIDDELWQAAQALRATNSKQATFGRNVRRPKRVLSGLLRCGVCGESYIVHTKDHVGCSARRNKGTCDNARMMGMGEIEQRVLSALSTHLLSPAMMEAAVEAYRLERELREKQQAKDRRALERELADAKVATERILDMICKGIGDQADLGQRLKETAARRRELEAKLSSATKTVVTIHPQAAQRYRAKVEEIQEALTKGDAASQDAVALVRSMIERIVITPQPDRMDLQVFGELSMLLGNTPSTEGELADCISGCGGLHHLLPNRSSASVREDPVHAYAAPTRSPR